MTTLATRAALVGLTLAGGALLFTFDPAVTRWFPSCPLFALTGWRCPLCGSLRAVHALLHGHFTAAIAFNPMTTAGAVATGLSALHDALRPAARPFVDRLVSRCFSLQGLAFAVTFGMVRNLR
jgi:hypothetical protein